MAQFDLVGVCGWLCKPSDDAYSETRMHLLASAGVVRMAETEQRAFFKVMYSQRCADAAAGG